MSKLLMLDRLLIGLKSMFVKQYEFNLIQLVAWSLLVSQTNLTIFGVLLPSRRLIQSLPYLHLFGLVVTLPAIIDQLRTNTVVTLHGCVHVHVPFAHQNL
ncbi:hypothetical protein KY290_010893 [Solanum tuberosum]|uniref:Uncharacterized protein n=1 Tax=Solanum tuberosum TaxID=4113 RepID=A0ABQ7VZ29_SOLTU|nr:hypothetical protein KY290_010893 [Solanum tuberosum]